MSRRVRPLSDQVVDVTGTSSGIGTPFDEHQANHTRHEAVIPRPTYAPQVVADVILDAAVVPRREVTVGGVGCLQSLVGMHAPAWVEAEAGFLLALPLRTDRPNRSSPSLFAAGENNRERSGKGATFHRSLYNEALRKPGLLVTVGLAAIAVALSLARPARRSLRLRVSSADAAGFRSRSA